MTVCIAGACQHHGEPRIVLCCDSRLDFGEVGSTNNACKVRILGCGWVGLIAGDWTRAQYFSGIVRDSITYKRPTSLESAIRCINAAIKRYQRSPIYATGYPVELIASGFVNNTPQIITVTNHLPVSEDFTITTLEFSAIGSGCNVANVILTAREYHAGLSLKYATYLCYEAKRCSEKAEGVGRGTMLVYQSPMNPETLYRGSLAVVTDAGIAHWEDIWGHLWKVPLFDLPDFPPDYFRSSGAIPGLESTTTDPSPQPPSQE
jgi:20S proteasome alpha/beta subunit